MPPKRASRSSSRGRVSASARPSLSVSEDDEVLVVKKPSKKASKGRSRSQTPSRGNKKVVEGESKARKKSASRSNAKSPARESKSKSKSATKAKKEKKVYKMKHSEEEKVMARWPGTNLYFKGEVVVVREEDNEYDVRFEDGTEYTLKAKDVKANNYLGPRARSRSRGRTTTQETKTKASSAGKASPKSPRSRLDNSVDSEKSRERSNAKGKDDEIDGSFKRVRIVDVLVALIFLSLGPLKLISLHLLCQPRSCKLNWPVFPQRLEAYWDQESFLITLTFFFAIRILSYVPLGKTVLGRHGKPIRLNGFIIGLAFMALLPIFVARKVDVGFVNDHFFHLMISTSLISILSALVLFFFASWFGTEQNPKGSTGNLVVDFFHGRQINAYLFGLDVKLLLLRASMITLSFINGCLLSTHVFPSEKNFKRQQLNPAVLLQSLFQIGYALGQLLFEEYSLYSHDGVSSGLGFGFVLSSLTFPFASTLVTRYTIFKAPTIAPFELVAIAILFTLGYVMYRSSENQRCEFIKDPFGPSVRDLEVISAAHSSTKRILCSGWWSFVRFPNYLGEAIVFWSFVLPAVSTAGSDDVLIYYVPIMSTVVTFLRVQKGIERRKEELGETWEAYCKRVEANLIPYVY